MRPSTPTAQPPPITIEAIKRCSCLVLCLIGNLAAQVGSGTIVVVKASPEKLIIAADSKLKVNHGYHDCACKIISLGDRMIFAATGRMQINTWSANQAARDAFHSISRKEPGGPRAARVAQLWGSLVRPCKA